MPSSPRADQPVSRRAGTVNVGGRPTGDWPVAPHRGATMKPPGPFLAYDHPGAIVSSVYMILLADMNAQKSSSD